MNPAMNPAMRRAMTIKTLYYRSIGLTTINSELCLDFIAAKPGINSTAIGNMMGVSEDSIYGYMRSLVSLDLIIIKRIVIKGLGNTPRPHFFLTEKGELASRGGIK